MDNNIMTQNNDMSDILYNHPDLDKNDKQMVSDFFKENYTKFKNRKNASYLFADVEQKDFLNQMDSAVKAILNHLIDIKRGD